LTIILTVTPELGGGKTLEVCAVNAVVIIPNKLVTDALAENSACTALVGLITGTLVIVTLA
jgi:hypothetical protein